MPHKHGASHAFATLITTTTSSLMVWSLRDTVPIVYDALDSVANFLLSVSHLPLEKEAFTPILLATILAFIWGVGYYYIHEEKKGS